MRKISADFIYIDCEFKKDTLLVVDDEGVIKSIESSRTHEGSDVAHYKGALLPGLINCHCHLELSHLINKVATGIGLPQFLISVVQQRDADVEFIHSKIQKHDRLMWESGIQAVGDISNTTHTLKTKKRSPIQYLTFVEMFDLFIANQTDTFFNQYADVYLKFKENGLAASASPHAPYSVSDELYNKINTLNEDHNLPISIHNQETESENAFTERLSGDLTLLYQALDIPLLHTPSGKRSVNHAMDQISHSHATLLVHNTMSEDCDLKYLSERKGDHYWVSCPRANLFIENRLPRYSLWQDHNAHICLGTDSLTSNYSLSIWQEMRTIHRYQSSIDKMEILKWATINGAVALGMNERLGSISLEKSPGLIQVPMLENGEVDLTTDIEPVRII